MKFDDLAQRILREYSDDEVLAKHLQARKAAPAQNVWVEFTSTDRAQKLQHALEHATDPKHRGIMDATPITVDSDEVGLDRSRELRGTYFKVVNQYAWAAFQRKYGLQEGEDFHTHAGSEAYSKLVAAGR